MTEYRLLVQLDDNKIELYRLLMDATIVDGESSMRRALMEFQRINPTEDEVLIGIGIKVIRARMMQAAVSRLWPGARFVTSALGGILNSSVEFDSQEDLLQFKLTYL